MLEIILMEKTYERRPEFVLNGLLVLNGVQKCGINKVDIKNMLV